MNHPTVFISYTHDSEKHRRDVREFATFLVRSGIRVVLDQWEDAARKDWYPWATKNIREADHVLVIASAGYWRMGDGYGPNDENLGGRAEAALLRDLLQRDRARWTAKILPVVLPGHTIDEISDFLQPYAADHYPVTSLSPEGAETLLRAITRQVAHVRPPLGPLVDLPPRSGPGAEQVRSQPPTEPRWTVLAEPPPVFWLDKLIPRLPMDWQAVLELHVVPAEPDHWHGVRQLEAAQDELAEVGRACRIFSAADGLSVGHFGDAVWAYVADQRDRQTGLAVHRHGQRTCWGLLHRATIGWIFDRDAVVDQLTEWLRALTAVSLPLPPRVAFAAGIAQAVMVRVGRLSDAAARSAPVPLGRHERIRLQPEEAISADELRRVPRPVAEELAARLTVALK